MPRSWSAAGASGAGFAVVATVAFADGGYFRTSWLWIVLALVSLAGIALLLRERIELGRLEIYTLVALSGFTGWVALSAAWSSLPRDSLLDAQRGLIYVAALLAFALSCERETARDLLAGVALAAVVVAGYALVDRISGGVGEPDPIAGTRLFEPLGYANALAVLAALGIVLALGLVLDATSPIERFGWLVGVLILLAALVLTESRGTILALVVGLSVLTWTRSRHPAVLAAVAVALVGVVVAAVVAVDRTLGARVDYWRVAWRQYEDNALLGAGAGTFRRYWEQASMPVSVRDAHSLYLETLAELGPVGILLLLAALGLPFLAFFRGRGDPVLGVAVSAYATFLVHAGLDWDWELPAVTIAGLTCATGLLVRGRDRSGMMGLELMGRTVLAAAAIAIATAAISLQVLVD